MIISPNHKKCKCAGDVNCYSRCEYKIKFAKYSINLCPDCIKELHQELSKMIVPKAVKSKFNWKIKE